MQKELTISLSEETYRGLMELVGEKKASQFIEAFLSRYFSEYHEEYEVKLPFNDEKRKIYILSPHLANSIDLPKIKMEVLKEEVDA